MSEKQKSIKFRLQLSVYDTKVNCMESMPAATFW